jgi:hypothetical protein
MYIMFQEVGFDIYAAGTKFQDKRRREVQHYFIHAAWPTSLYTLRSISVAVAYYNINGSRRIWKG